MPSPSEIRSARERAGLTQTEAAAILGYDRVTWWRYETGEQTPKPHEWAYWLHVTGQTRIPFSSSRVIPLSSK
jgi:putative transcriptional regulator